MFKGEIKMKKEIKSKLEQHPGCKGCNKSCNWRAPSVAEGSIKKHEMFGCNSVKQWK